MTFTNWWQQFKQRILHRPPVITTIIDGWTEQVSEGPRRQAAINMRGDPVLRKRIEEMVGEAEARRRYPEAYR